MDYGKMRVRENPGEKEEQTEINSICLLQYDILYSEYLIINYRIEQNEI